jgi:hypothetical protein
MCANPATGVRRAAAAALGVFMSDGVHDLIQIVHSLPARTADSSMPG